MISQYAATNKDIAHAVVEHDPQWIDFFCKGFELPLNTDIVQLPWGYVTYNEALNVRVYDGFADRFADNSYDFICVDGPLGGDMPQFARIDILGLIPQHLEKSFVIILDDYNRAAEKNTAREITRKLDEAGIAYSQGQYQGEKSTLIICSADKKFLCSL